MAHRFERMRVVGKQHQRGQPGRADGIALGDGLGGVADGVERIGDGAHGVGQARHFRDAARVIRDGAIRVERDDDARHRQHGRGGDRNAVQTGQLIRDEDGDADGQHRIRRGLHRHAQAGDDIRAVARRRRFGDVAHGLEVRARVVLGDVHHQAREDDADDGGAQHLVAHGVVRPQQPRHHGKAHQRQASRPPQARVQGRHDLRARLGFHHRAADDGAKDGNGAQQQRIDDGRAAGLAHQQCAQQHGGDQRHDIGFEQVGRHAGAVAHVVAHVVGDDGRVARIVLGDARLDLAHQVRAHVGALGEDAAAQPREDGNERGAKRQADQRFDQVMLRQAGRARRHQQPVEQGHAQQAQADHQHAGDRAALEGHVQGLVDAQGGRLRRAHIRPHRDIHADEAAGARQHGADQKAQRRMQAKQRIDGDQQHHAHKRDGAVLARQVGGRALLDGQGNFLHARVAGILAQDPATRHQTVNDCDHAAGYRKPQTGCHIVPFCFYPTSLPTAADRTG